MWAFGRGPNSTQIGAWWSTDLTTWHQGLGLQLNGFGHTANDYEVFNNNVHFGRGGEESYVMAIELGKPADVTGQPFTSVFASHDGSDDLSTGWTFLDPHTHVWPPLKPQHGKLYTSDSGQIELTVSGTDLFFRGGCFRDIVPAYRVRRRLPYDTLRKS